MNEYAYAIYKLELESGPYSFDVSLPDTFMEKQLSNVPYYHIHAKYEIVFVCRKDGSKPGFFQVNPPQRKHATCFRQDSEQLYQTCIRFSIKKRQGAEYRDSVPGGSVLEAFLALQNSTIVQDTFRGQQRILALRKELREKDIGFQEVARAELLMLLLELARRLPAEQIAEQPASANLDEIKLELIDEFFMLNYNRPNCKREELAQVLCISERQLSRIFAQNYSMSFRERLLQTRMEMAETMRKTEHYSAEQLSEKVGYSSASAFRAAYRNYFGHSFREK